MSKFSALFVLMLAFGALQAAGTAQAQTVIGAEPALIQAADAGDLEAARVELLRGANPNMPDIKGRNPVIIAARNGDLEMIDLLIDQGSSPNWQDEIGNSALHWAVQNGDWVTVDSLLSYEANPDITNGQGLTPIMVATREGYRDLVERLIKADADLGVRDYTGRSVLDYARTSRTPGLEPILRDAGAEL
jgi:ankyrin repeat protein